MDIRVLARATTARRWLLVNVVDNSQCARAVKAFVRRSCRTNSTGNLCSNCVAGSPGGSRCVCQVGKSSDMYPDHRVIPINTIINYCFRHIYINGKISNTPPFDNTPNDTGTIGLNSPSLPSQTLSKSGSIPHACKRLNNNCATSIVAFGSLNAPFRFTLFLMASLPLQPSPMNSKKTI